MEIAQLVLGYVQALIWPCVTVIMLLLYRGVIESLIPQSKLNFIIAGVTIEASLDASKSSVEECFRGRRFPTDHWN